MDINSIAFLYGHSPKIILPLQSMVWFGLVGGRVGYAPPHLHLGLDAVRQSWAVPPLHAQIYTGLGGKVQRCVTMFDELNSPKRPNCILLFLMMGRWCWTWLEL